MAEYKSKHSRLGFYVGEKARSFVDGLYVSEDAAEMKVLDALPEVVRVDEAPKTEAKPAAKAPARKPSAK